jgi:hypothetical protein
VRHTLRFRAAERYDPGGASVLLAIKLALGDSLAEVEAVLDTGATYSVFQREVGEMLGLGVETGEALWIETVQGRFLTYTHAVTLVLGGVALEVTVSFAAEYGFPRNILGRRGVLDRLRLGLVDYDGMVFLSHYDDPQDEDA